MLEHCRIQPERVTGFKRCRCTVDNIGKLASSLEVARSTGRTAHVTFVDNHRGFDAFPSNASLRHLSHIGICGRLITHLKAFLSARTLQVKVGTMLSLSRSVTVGVVPQRSILSSLFLNVALAALPQYLHGYKLPTIRLAIYADDIRIWCVCWARSATIVRAFPQGSVDRAQH